MRVLLVLALTLSLVLAVASEHKTSLVEEEKTRGGGKASFHHPPKEFRGLKGCQVKAKQPDEKHKDAVERTKNNGNITVAPAVPNNLTTKEVYARLLKSKDKNKDGVIDIAIILNSALFHPVPWPHSVHYSPDKVFSMYKKQLEKLKKLDEFKDIKVKFHPVYTVDTARRLKYSPKKGVYWEYKDSEGKAYPKAKIVIDGKELGASQTDPDNEQLKKRLREAEAIIVSTAGVPFKTLDNFHKMKEPISNALEDETTIVLESRLAFNGLPIREYMQHPWGQIGTLRLVDDEVQEKSVGKTIASLMKDRKPGQSLKRLPVVTAWQLHDDDRFLKDGRLASIEYRLDPWMLIEGASIDDFKDSELVKRVSEERKDSLKPLDDLFKETGFKKTKFAISMTGGVVSDFKPGFIRFTGVPTLTGSGEDQVRPRVFFYSSKRKASKDCHYYWAYADGIDVVYDDKSGDYQVYSSDRKKYPSSTRPDYPEDTSDTNLANLVLRHATPKQFRKFLKLGKFDKEQRALLFPKLLDVARAIRAVSEEDSKSNRKQLKKVRAKLTSALDRAGAKSSIQFGRAFAKQLQKSLTPRQLLRLMKLGRLEKSERSRLIPQLRTLETAWKRLKEKKSAYLANRANAAILDVNVSLLQMELARLKKKFK